MTMSLFDSLADDLSAATVRRARRASKVRAILHAGVGTTAAVLVAVVAIVGIEVHRSVPVGADVRVTYTGGHIEVLLVDVEHDADLIEAAAAEAGLDIDVESVPTGPSQVGRFVSYVSDSTYNHDVVTIGDTNGSFAGFVVPVGWDGSMDLRVGRPARAGEGYASFSDATAPGEPFACADVDTLDVDSITDRAERSGVTLRWQVISGGSAQTIDASQAEQRINTPGGPRISALTSLSPSSVMVTLSDGVPEAAHVGC